MKELLSIELQNVDCDFDRISKLQYRMEHRTPTICPERAEIITESYKKTEGEPIVIRRAKAFADILSKMTIYIEPDSIIVGNQASANFAAPIFPEYSFNWVIEELDKFEHRSGDMFYITEDTKDRLRALQPYWHGITHQDEVLRNLPEVNFKAEEQCVLHRGGISMSGDGHIIPNYEFVLKNGYGGFANIARCKLENPEITQDQRDFYEAAIIANEAALIYIKRFSALCIEQASAFERAGDDHRAKELNWIGNQLAEFMEGGARNYWEAVECVYLTHVLMMIESNGHSFSFGRFDQYVYPYYKADLDAGKITREKALEITTHFFIMCNSLNKIRPWGHTQYSCGYPLYSNLMVGGMKPDGTDGTNDISYLCLEAMNQTLMPEPNLSVRFSKDTPRSLIVDAAKLNSKGYGMPSMFCDETVIPAMLTLEGVDEEVARDYASMGCVETAIPGRWGHRATGMTYINFGKILEIILNNGMDPESGVQLFSVNGESGNKVEYASYDELWDEWCRALDFYMKLAVDCDMVCDRSLKYHDADAFASCTINYSLERGKTLKNGGSEYDYISQSNIGMSVVGDSLAAVKKLVFEEHKLTLDELREVCLNNFEGPEGARIRKMCREVPKFGNDDDYVDSIVADVYESYLALLPSYTTDRAGQGPIGCRYSMSTSNITSYVPNGFDVGATPDGRLAGKPLNEGCSPCLGADHNGPTAVINSVSKLPNKRMAGGQLLNMRFSPASLAGEENLDKFTSFIEAMRYKNIFHNQFNVLDTETMRDAQKHPEDHADLMVRVAGYCALFNTLMPETQDAIIERTELAL